ncbi:MAG: phosphoribosylaminoimidazolesuccinocarboxamide synthase [Halobacteriaceae archaeon]
MTSVKDVVVADPPGEGPGRGRFAFTDDYSVFDWGTMPDQIPGKGASLCAMGAHTFEALAAAGVPTHYRGVVVDGAVESLDAAAEAPTRMAIDLADVPDLPADGDGYDYDAYHGAAGPCHLVPLEIVFRNTVPRGSSLRRRADPGDVGLDADSWPDEAVDLPEPVVEFSTKFEGSDRYLDRQEAAEIAGPAALDDLAALARETNAVVTDLAAAAGLDHQDGKIECLYDRGEVRVADVAGTLDENRFSYEGTQVSKETVRQYYRRTQPDWLEAIEAAKETARARGVDDWTSLCNVTPDPLPDPVQDAVADLYAAAADAYVGRDLTGAPDLASAVETARSI